MESIKEYWLTQNYDDDTIASGEALFKYKLVEFVMGEKDRRYQLLVKDGSDYTVDITYPFKKNQTTTCDCATYISSDSCAHIVSSLLYLQDQLSASEVIENPLEIKADQKKLSKINIGQILESVSHRDLIEFIRESARKDPKLSVAIKVHFARKIEVGDDIDKYKSILNAVIKPKTRSDARLLVADVRSLIYVLDDFHGQMLDCLALGQYKEAYNIFVASMDKLLYSKHLSHVLQDKLTGLSHQYHMAISEFLKEKLAPELRTSLVNYLLELSGRSYYAFEHIKYNVVYQIAQFKKKQDTPLLIDACRADRLKPSMHQAEMLLALEIMVKNKVESDVLVKITDQKLVTLQIVEYLEILDLGSLAINLLKISIKKTSRIDRDLSMKLMRIYIRTHAWDELVDQCMHNTIITFDYEYINIIKKHVTPEIFLGLLHKVENKLQHEPKALPLMLKIYQDLEDVDAIIAICAAHNLDLKMLQSCEIMIYAMKPKELSTLYQMHISAYVDAHAGDNVHAYLVELRHHIQKSKFDKLIIPIVSLLSNQYEHRPKLAKAFALMLGE